MSHENVVPWGLRETENPVFISWWHQLESSLETYVVPAKHWANNEGITIKELILWGTQTVNKHHSVACDLMGTILGVMGNMGMDTRLNSGDKVRNGFLEEEIKAKTS